MLQLLLGVLAAFGLVCAVWAVFGVWISGARGWAAVCFCGPGGAAALRRCCWLRDWGLLRGPILAVHRGLSRERLQSLSRELENVEFCSLEELPARLELELEKFAGTGDADPTGHCSRSGVSEL